MKRKINIDRPKLSAKEIASRQDFSGLINQLPKVTKPPFYKTGWFITTVASVTGIAVITTNFILNDKTSTQDVDLATTTEVLPSTPSSNEFQAEQTSLIQSSSIEDESLTVSSGDNTSSSKNDTPNATSPVEHETQDLAQTKKDIADLENAVNDSKLAFELARDERVNFESSAPTPPVSDGNKDRQFILDIDPGDFPELAYYKNLLFEVEANDPNFSPSVYQEEWEDIALKTKKAGKTYYLTLFKKDISKTFSVFPVYSGADYDVALNKYNISLSKYTEELEQKTKEEEQKKLIYEQNLAQLNNLKNQETNLSKTN